jgi:sarcosine oxidase/L-pipecolate oxidase
LIPPPLCKLKKIKKTPLYKKGDIHDVKNYRPIAILLVFSKIIQKLMNNRLIPFLVDNSVLTEAQNGFRKNKSTDSKPDFY